MHGGSNSSHVHTLGNEKGENMPNDQELQPGEGTKVRMGLASQGDNRSIYGSKFMEGGIASLNVKK